MIERKIDRRTFISSLSGVAGLAILSACISKRARKEVENLVTPSRLPSDDNALFFPPSPSKEQRPPGLASMKYFLEKGVYSEIYQLLIEQPFIGFKIDGQYISNVFGEGINTPSVIKSNPLKVEYNADNEPQWTPDPLTVDSFLIPPGSLQGNYNGNCLFIHSFSLIPFGIYKGVYEDTHGRVFVGNKGAYRQNTKPIGIMRYPLAPNGEDELVLFGTEKEGRKISPDFGDEVAFRCTDAQIVSAQAANEMITENPESNVLYVQTCYPPEWSNLNSPPPGRVVMKMEKINF